MAGSQFHRAGLLRFRNDLALKEANGKIDDGIFAPGFSIGGWRHRLKRTGLRSRGRVGEMVAQLLFRPAPMLLGFALGAAFGFPILLGESGNVFVGRMIIERDARSVGGAEAVRRRG